ncbi:MAG: hypothetical protein CVV27_12220 [Candidatus Melainabacteria bacterium HGW-Melainabacteria-1]|nr:MAG: hypothetical protein CVV27_12220 [Candidatus Melainabacteria bacterium HGW-Melainabacteria-1]
MVAIQSRPLLEPGILFQQSFNRQAPAPQTALPQAALPKPAPASLPRSPLAGTAPTVLAGLFRDEGIPAGLDRAAQLAVQTFFKHPTACEQTANHLHAQLLGKGPISVRYLPRAAGLNENGQALSYLNTLLDQGLLRPGMIVFINSDPDMQMPRLSPSNRHWFTYMGRESDSRQPVFCDQFGHRRSLQDMLDFEKIGIADLPGRKERRIHTIFDPYSTQPEKLHQLPGRSQP